jgi:hypothetical protein
MSNTFSDIWPGDRRWIMMDICSEQSEVNDCAEKTIKHYSLQSDSIAHWACDIGLPCISMSKHTERFNLIGNSAMAPFGPIDLKTTSMVMEAFANCLQSPGVSCGWYCPVNQFETLKSTVFPYLFSQEKYRFLVYGPENSGFINMVILFLQSIAAEVWVISDGVRKETIAKLTNEVFKIRYSNVKCAYENWTP